MSFADRLRAFFAKRAALDLGELERFAAERQGLEGFIEPRTATNPLTLLLVDRDGDNRRAPIRDERDAHRFCDPRGIPVYDAGIVGYPRRMRDFEQGRPSTQEAWDERFAEIERSLQEAPPPDTPDR